MTPLPPDVAAARRVRLNNELVELFNKPPSQKSDGKGPSFKGVGVYTHVARSAIVGATSSTQRPAPSGPNLDFLPLRGFTKSTGRATVQGEIPEEIKAIYRDVSTSLESEGKLIDRGIHCDPHVRFGTLELPPSTSRVWEEPTQKQRHDAAEPARLNMGTQDGNTPGFSANNAAANDAIKAKSAGGPTYDESRDPRRRGR